MDHITSLRIAAQLRAKGNKAPTTSDCWEEFKRQTAERLQHELGELQEASRINPATLRLILSYTRWLAKLWISSKIAISDISGYILQQDPHFPLSADEIHTTLRDEATRRTLEQVWETSLIPAPDGSFRLITLAQHQSLDHCKIRLAEYKGPNTCAWCGIHEGFNSPQMLRRRAMANGTPDKHYFHAQGCCITAYSKMEMRVEFSEPEKVSSSDVEPTLVEVIEPVEPLL